MRQGRVLRRAWCRSVRLYSTAPAQEQGARLTTMRHRRFDFSQKLVEINGNLYTLNVCAELGKNIRYFDNETQKSIEKINVSLEQKLTQLKTLESEKKDIIARYKKASEDERTAIESEMAQSEQKF